MTVSWTRVRSLRLAAMVVLAAALGACGDDSSTAPRTEFDAERAADALASVLSTADGNEDVYASLELVGQTLSTSPSASAALLPGGAGPASLLPSPAAARTLDPAAAMFPSNLLGRTLVYDPAVDRYVVDEEATGAPENGVRFIYYAIDPISRRPAEPLNALGHLDLTDESSPASTRLGVEVVSAPEGAAPVTLIDYFIDAAYAVTVGTAEVVLTAEGYLSDGDERLDFDLAQSVKVTEGEALEVAIDHQLELAEAGIAVALRTDTHVQAEGGIGSTATLELMHGGESVVMEIAQVSATQVEGTVSHNGKTAIVIDGAPGQLTFTRPDGSAIGQAEIQALLVLRDGIAAVAEFAEKIFAVFDNGA